MLDNFDAEQRANALWAAIARCQISHDQAVESVCRKAGLTPPQARLAENLLAGPRGLGDLARAMEMANGNVTVIVGNLVKAGYAQRESSTGDRRAAQATLTDQGAAIAASLKSQTSTMNRLLAAALNADEQEILTRLLLKLVAGAESDGYTL